MKLNVNYFLAFVASAVLFTSCEQDSPVAPSTIGKASTEITADGIIAGPSDGITRVDYGSVKGYKLNLPRYYLNTSNQSFFSTSLGKKYSMNSVQSLNLYSKIDFFCTYEQGVSKIHAPSSFNNNTGVFTQPGAVDRQTNFSYTTLTVNDLGKAVKSPEYIKANFHTYNIPYTQLQLTTNSIYAFKTDTDTSGKIYGLIRVLDIEIDYVTIEVFVNENQL